MTPRPAGYDAGCGAAVCCDAVRVCGLDLIGLGRYAGIWPRGGRVGMLCARGGSTLHGFSSKGFGDMMVQDGIIGTAGGCRVESLVLIRPNPAAGGS